MRYLVGLVDDLPPGTCKIVAPHGGQGIGVFNVDGRFHALKNTCPHQGAPLCLGRVSGTSTAQLAADRPPELEWVREGEIVACPWHQWEFEIATGKTVFPSRNRVATYRVTVEHERDPRLTAGVQTYPVVVEQGSVLLELPDR